MSHLYWHRKTIINNDPDENPYTFVVSGTGVAAEVSLVKSITPTSAEPGESITYTLTFSNTGNDIASDVVITDYLPVSVTVQSVISSGDVVITRTFNSQTAEVFETSAVSSGAGGIITITGVLSNPLATGIFTNTAIITTTSVESNIFANNEAEAGLTVNNVAPVATSATFSVAESAANGTGVGTVSSTDANGDSLTFSISSGNSDNIFTIGSSG